MMTLGVTTMSKPPWAQLTQGGSEVICPVQSRGQSGMRTQRHLEPQWFQWPPGFIMSRCRRVGRGDPGLGAGWLLAWCCLAPSLLGRPSLATSRNEVEMGTGTPKVEPPKQFPGWPSPAFLPTEYLPLHSVMGLAQHQWPWQRPCLCWTPAQNGLEPTWNPLRHLGTPGEKSDSLYLTVGKNKVWQGEAELFEHCPESWGLPQGQRAGPFSSAPPRVPATHLAAIPARCLARRPSRESNPNWPQGPRPCQPAQRPHPSQVEQAQSM